MGVVILAGGASSRMGRDKARLSLDGRSLLAHVRAAARSLDYPVRIIRRDRIGRCGPLGGIYTALRSSRSGAELFLACDMPFISPGLLRRIARSLRVRDQASFAVVGRRTGFPFVIRSEAAPIVKRQILRGQLSVHALARVLKARRIMARPAEKQSLFNINTPEEFAAATQRSSAQRRSRSNRKDVPTGPR